MLFFWLVRNAIVVLVAIRLALRRLFVMKLMNLTSTRSRCSHDAVVGILVDDSTVSREIERHHEMGQPPAEAAVSGRSESDGGDRHHVGRRGSSCRSRSPGQVVATWPSSDRGRHLDAHLAVRVVPITRRWPAMGLKGTGSPLLHPQVRAGLHLGSHGTHRALPWREGAYPGDRFLPVSFVGAMLLVPFASWVPSSCRGRPGEIFAQITFPVGTPLTTTSKRCSSSSARSVTCPTSTRTRGFRRVRSPFGGFLVQATSPSSRWLKDERKQHELLGEPVRQLAAKTLPNTQVVVIPATGTGGNAQRSTSRDRRSGGHPPSTPTKLYK